MVARRRSVLFSASLGGLSLFLALLSWLAVAHDGRRRLAGLELVPSLEPSLQSTVTRTMEVQESADLAVAIAAQVVLEQAERSSSGGEGSGTPGSLAAARERMLAATADRPGWAHHRFLLARAAYLLPKGEGDAAAWLDAGLLAAAGAPGIDSIWEWLGERCVRSWAVLSPRHRDQALPVLSRALLDPSYVERDFLMICQLLPDRAVSLLPDEVSSLRAALGALPPESGLEIQRQAVEARLRSLSHTSSGS